MRRDLQIHVVPRMHEFTGSVQETTDPRCFLLRSFPITDNWPRRFARFLLYSFARIPNWAKTQFSSLDPYRISSNAAAFPLDNRTVSARIRCTVDVLYFPCIASWMVDSTLLSNRVSFKLSAVNYANLIVNTFKDFRAAWAIRRSIKNSIIKRKSIAPSKVF